MSQYFLKRSNDLGDKEERITAERVKGSNKDRWSARGRGSLARQLPRAPDGQPKNILRAGSLGLLMFSRMFSREWGGEGHKGSDKDKETNEVIADDDPQGEGGIMNAKHDGEMSQ